MAVTWCPCGIHGQDMEETNQWPTNLDQDHTKELGPNPPPRFQTKLAQCMA